MRAPAAEGGMTALKSMIREKLHGSPVVAQALQERPELQDDTAGLLQYLEEKGLVEDIFASLETNLQRHMRPAPPAAAEAAAAAALVSEPPRAAVAGAAASSGWQLCLRLTEGRAFLDYLDERDAAGRELQWHLAFGRQRLRTRPVPAAVDPRFDEVLFLELPAAGSRVALLQHGSPMHLVLTCRNSADVEEDPWATLPRSVVCSHLLEWRHCLSAAGPVKLTEELLGVGRRHKLAVGVLHGEVELRPVGGPASLLPEHAVGAQLREEERKRSDVMRRVFEDLDRWWSEYHELYLDRHIRIFAQTESCLFLPVTSFVTRLEAGRALDAPSQALRWTSLIGTDTSAAAESSEPRWHTFPALWARGLASVEEKVLLLCSLLLGYSLDAWCCLGTDVRGQPHSWVIVRDQGDTSLPADVTCWDVRAVARIPVDEPRYLATYSSIDTVFNDRCLLICHLGTAAHVSFDFRDPRQWLPVPLDSQAVDALTLYPTARCPPFADLRPRVWGLPLETELIEEAIEKRICNAMRAHREATSLPTAFDEHLAQLLQVALANCEQERALGTSMAPVFEGIVRRVCPHGEVFRAVPVQFIHLRVSLYWPVMSDRQAMREVLASPAHAIFAVRARVVPYPEGAVAVWALVAARGRL